MNILKHINEDESRWGNQDETSGQITSPTNSAVGKQSSHNKSGSTHANQKKLSSLLSDGHSVPRAAAFDP